MQGLNIKEEPLQSLSLYWKLLLSIAIILNTVVILTSELGLDSHVREALVESEQGWSLDWGDVRTSSPMGSDPNDSTIFDSASNGSTKQLAVIGMILAIIICWRLKFDIPTITVLMINPALIFSVGRGYYEYTYLAMLGASWAIWHNSRNYSKEKGVLSRIVAITFSASILLWVLMIKLRIELGSLFLPLIGLVLIGYLIDMMPNERFNPKKSLLFGFSGGILGVVILGILDYGTFAVITDEPARFLQALPISIFGVIIIYGLFGMVIWPFITEIWKVMSKENDRVVSELCLLIGVLTGSIMTYVACLWTFESILWGSQWPWHMWTMGNNGRYITILAIPSYLLIKQVNGNINWDQPKAITGVLLLLPLSFAAGIHGQTYWTDDAANQFSSNMENDDQFLLIHDSSLGMHYLYTFHTYIDNVEERNITGHWRSPESNWYSEIQNEQEFEMLGNISGIEWIIFAPGTAWATTGAIDGWYLHSSGKADFMNGGDEWSVWTYQDSDSD